MYLSDQTTEEKVLNSKIFDLENHIVNAGAYINSITEDCFSGVITKDNGEVIDGPVASADEILEVAKEIKEMAIQYEALTDLENEIENKKAADGAQDPTQGTDND